jgi:anti-sigma B factor antagonist
MGFSFEIKEQQGSTTFLLKGKLINEGDSLQLNNLIDQEIASGTFQIVFDLAKLETCNSSGLQVLIRTLTKTRTKNGDTVVCAVNANLDKLFAVTKLNEIFSLYPTQKEALTHFKK